MSKLYNNMPHRIDARSMLINVLRSKGVYVAMPAYDPQARAIAQGANYDRQMTEASRKMHSSKTSTPIHAFVDGKAKYKLGLTYFMPVWLRPSGSEQIEIPIAAISIKGKKTIIETPLVGRNGSVKELISINDYEIDIDGIVISDDRNYPEEGVQQIAELFKLNESVELISAVSDLVLYPGMQIVIKTVDYPKVGGVENMQAFSFTAATDTSIELEIK